MEHDQRRLFAGNRCERRHPIVDGVNLKTFTLKIQARQLDDGGFVVDEEDEFVQG